MSIVADCSRCGVSVPTSPNAYRKTITRHAMKEHGVTVTDFRFTCSLCPVECVNLRAIRAHWSGEHTLEGGYVSGPITLASVDPQATSVTSGAGTSDADATVPKMVSAKPRPLVPQPSKPVLKPQRCSVQTSTSDGKVLRWREPASGKPRRDRLPKQPGQLVGSSSAILFHVKDRDDVQRDWAEVARILSVVTGLSCRNFSVYRLGRWSRQCRPLVVNFAIPADCAVFLGRKHLLGSSSALRHVSARDFVFR